MSVVIAIVAVVCVCLHNGAQKRVVVHWINGVTFYGWALEKIRIRRYSYSFVCAYVCITICKPWFAKEILVMAIYIHTCMVCARETVFFIVGGHLISKNFD